MYTVLFTFLMFAVTISFLCSLWEAVLLSISPTQALIIIDKGGFIGNHLKQYKENIDKPLAGILTLNTFAHTIGAVGVGEQAIIIWGNYNPLITGVIVPIAMTLAILILSEIIPKTIGANFWNKLIPFTVYSLGVILFVLYPLVWMCQLITKFFRSDKNTSVFSRSDFLALAEIGTKEGVFKEVESDIIEGTLDLSELRVLDVMRPSSDIIMVNKNDSIDMLLEVVKKHRYSRYPVYDSDENSIQGVIHVKDVLEAITSIEHKNSSQPFTVFIRPILKVHYHLPVIDLLRKFREGMPHFALVYKNDELLGFITLDNVLRVIIGIIKDEFHRTHEDWIINEDGSITANGSCSIYSLEQALDRDIELNNDSIQTISELILDQTKTLPKIGDHIKFEEFEAIIVNVNKTAIVKVRINPLIPIVSE